MQRIAQSCMHSVAGPQSRYRGYDTICVQEPRPLGKRMMTRFAWMKDETKNVSEDSVASFQGFKMYYTVPSPQA